MLITLIQFGIASIYLDHRVACPSEHYSAQALAAAHRTLPCGSRAEVVNLRNGRSVIVRITDRGPWKLGRIIDLTPEAAVRIEAGGLTQVSVRPLP